jgi:hypothetical protein
MSVRKAKAEFKVLAHVTFFGETSGNNLIGKYYEYIVISNHLRNLRPFGNLWFRTSSSWR